MFKLFLVSFPLCFAFTSLAYEVESRRARFLRLRNRILNAIEVSRV